MRRENDHASTLYRHGGATLTVEEEEEEEGSRILRLQWDALVIAEGGAPHHPASLSLSFSDSIRKSNDNKRHLGSGRTLYKYIC